MNWLSDYIVFTYKLHTNIQKNVILNHENFEVLTKDDFYMGLHGPTCRRCPSLFYYSIYWPWMMLYWVELDKNSEKSPIKHKKIKHKNKWKMMDVCLPVYIVSVITNNSRHWCLRVRTIFNHSVNPVILKINLICLTFFSINL